MIHLLLFFLMREMNQPIVVKVEEPEWLKLIDDPKHQARMGEETKRVEEETRTRITSPTQISAMEAPQPPNPQIHSKQIRDGGDLGKKLRSVTPSPNDIFLNSAENPASGLQNRLESFLPPDMKIGDVTALNTDQNLYYNFYRRMAEKIIWPWAQNVVAGFNKMKATGRLGGANRSWITVIEVILDKDGNVVSTQPMQLAGDAEIDNAPLNAFRQAKNFPNPPYEMVEEEDGFIHIRYKFMVYYQPTGRP